MLQPLLKFGTELQLVRVFFIEKALGTNFTQMRNVSSINVVVKLANYNGSSKKRYSSTLEVQCFAISTS